LVAGAVAGFVVPGLLESLSFAAILPAAEQHDSLALPLLLQHSALPSAIEEQAPSFAPQQPLSPGLVAHFIPSAEHLQPSDVPPTSDEASALAGTTFTSGFCSVEETLLEVLVALFVELVEFVELLVLSLPQPARPRTTTARNAANFIFMDCSPVVKPIKSSEISSPFGWNERDGLP
jgi:hypothetical protein